MIRVARAVILGAAIAACRGHTSSLPFYRTSAMTPEWLGDRDARDATLHRVAPFSLVDQHGATLSERSLAGRVTVAHFFFTKCGDVCPTTTTNLSRFLRDLGDSAAIQVLSHSVTPDADSIATLAAYAAEHGIIDARWHLLTGPRAAIAQLARDSYFVRLGDGSTYGVRTIAHTESVLLIDGCGHLRGIYAGTLALEMQRLREDAIALSRDNCSTRGSS